jgi:hypothetical protein
MTTDDLLLVILVALTLYNNGVQAYIHFEAYPLLAFVGRGEFAQYLAEYEKRLIIPLLLPYGLTVLANIAVIFIRDVNLPVLGVIVTLILNLAVAAVTVVLATPIYNRVKQAEDAATELKNLMNINWLRLLLSTASSLVILYLLLTYATA